MWRITCDTGGTFTDLVVADEQGFRTLAKASNAPDQMAEGIEAALRRAAAQLDLPLEELLRRYGALRAGDHEGDERDPRGDDGEDRVRDDPGLP
jgi:N-methylhydantoinase A